MVCWAYHKNTSLAGPQHVPQSSSLPLWCGAEHRICSVIRILLHFHSSNLLSSSLYQVLQNLGKDQYPQQSLEQIGTRIAKVLEKVSHPGGKLESCPPFDCSTSFAIKWLKPFLLVI